MESGKGTPSPAPPKNPHKHRRKTTQHKHHKTTHHKPNTKPNTKPKHQTVVHRDLTSYNILLDFGRPWRVLLCDFNLSRYLGQDAAIPNSGNPNSPGWQSPEMLAGLTYGTAADVFSFGVVVWEMLTLRQPWRDETEGRAALYVIMSEVIGGGRLALPRAEDVSPPFPEAADVIALAEACWRHDPASRPSMAAVASRLRAIIERVKARRREERERSAGTASASAAHR